MRQGVWIIASLAFLLAWGAAGAATPQRAAFRVDLSGTLTKEWTVTRTVEGDCDRVTTHTGRWQLTVTSRRWSRVFAIRPSTRRRPVRFSPALVGSLAGTATRTGSTRVVTTGPGCDRSVQDRTCAPQRRSFRGGSARLTSPRRGIARLGTLRRAAGARSFRRTCPEEPADIRSIRTELTLADAPLSAQDVFDRTVPRFFISGNATQETTLEGEYDGKVIERVRWTLAFTRLRR